MMRIIGKCIVDIGTYSDPDKLYKGPYPTGHPDLSEIDGDEAYGDYCFDHNYSDLFRFVRGEWYISFYPNLHLPFITSHYLSKFVVSHHSFRDGIKDFNVTFTTFDGNKITKEYQMGEMHPEHFFWQEFPIDLDNVISCDIHVISSWDGKQDNISFSGIRFVIDKEQEAKKEKELKELKELKRAEMKDLMSDFISSTQQRFEELEKKLSDEKEQRLHDKEEFEMIRASDKAQFEKELQSKQSHDDEERCTRHLLSKRAVVASLQSILSQVEQRPESEQFHFSVELEAVHRIVPSLK
ncbi:hypothetical protein ADUPG1_012545 [Aduncisulcus paluster]|uniref:Uncharacterized protein n=1 Tax=Aduncisulcus paluster TaxID=2918883 RepID=A0ABQ5JZU5_9EUKA|nr:hypothetical protein ADUPG1_012545 [Aduncisulcus paluster]